MRHFDAIVVGLGAMGSSITYSLAERGERVLALDRWRPPHDRGSTHGRSRIIREAYYEHPLYVPILKRAYDCWSSLEDRIGRQLLLQTGGLMIGDPSGELVTGALESARRYDLPHEMLDASEVRRRFPAYEPRDNMVALFEPRAGVLFPEECVAAFMMLSERDGALLKAGVEVERWSATPQGIVVETADERYSADKLVLAAGPWMPSLLGDARLPLEIERQEFHWFAPLEHPLHFAPDRCPIALWEYEPSKFWATFPDLGDGVKSGIHHEGETGVDPDTVRRTIDPSETVRHRDLLQRLVPHADGPLLDAKVCLYTNTPDHHFVIDVHPAHPAITIVSACSGHGFKFASAIGDLVADLVTTGAAPLDLSLFSAKRFT